MTSAAAPHWSRWGAPPGVVGCVSWAVPSVTRRVTYLHENSGKGERQQGKRENGPARRSRRAHVIRVGRAPRRASRSASAFNRLFGGFTMEDGGTGAGLRERRDGAGEVMPLPRSFAPVRWVAPGLPFLRSSECGMTIGYGALLPLRLRPRLCIIISRYGIVKSCRQLCFRIGFHLYPLVTRPFHFHSRIQIRSLAHSTRSTIIQARTPAPRR